MARIQRSWSRVAFVSAVGAALLALAGSRTVLDSAARADSLPAHGTAAAEDAAYVPRGRLGEVGTGTLLLDRGDRDRLVRAPTVATDVDITVRAIVARARVRQYFRNTTDGWVEGIYVFPLPATAAVDHLRLRVGDRVVEGRIAERAVAKRTYEAAKRQGRRAALLESERPNIFTTSIANIGPGEDVSVEIEYQQTLRYEDGSFSLRFPMVVAPRFIPGGRLMVSVGASGPVVGTGSVPDAGRITPPVRHPDLGKINPVRLAVSVDAGFPLAGVDSLYHPVTVERKEDHRILVRLRDGPVAADRDFVLTWAPEVEAVPGAALFRETVDGADYVLVMVMPPTTEAADDRAPPLRREAIFVLDTSGSMAGTSIRQAKAALRLAVDRLAPGDRFNVIRFANDTSALFPRPRAAGATNLLRARRYVDGLEAGGGTVMAPALAAALAGAPPDGILRQIVFLTDGAVGNEAEIFRLIDERLGASRLFTIGIGSAPNGYFMREAAEAGRGTFTYIGKLDEVGDRMAGLFDKLEHPVLTDISARWPGVEAAEVSTGIVPDLYAGEPVVFTARLAAATGVATLSGRVGTAPWRADLPLSRAAPAPGIAKLWARDRIDDLMGRLRKGGDAEAVRTEVIALALRHRLVTRYTSFVAVDATPARPADTPLGSAKLPLNLPQGWVYEKVFGGPMQATPARQRKASAGRPGGVQLASSAVRIGGTGGLALPQTATASPAHLLAGVVLLALGLLVVLLRRLLS